MPAALDLRNRTWITAHALPLTTGAAGSVLAARVEDSLDRAYESRWYVLKGLSAGDDVTVTLTLPPGFTEDYTLLGFTDIRVMAARLLAQLGTTGPLDADDMDSDDMDSDDMDSDDMDSDDMDSGDLGSDPISEIVRQQLSDVYASAQRHSLRSASVT
ncbi:MAG TPA: hypothetical protein VFV20_04405, partial [Candidatus Limnocylindria bacterium]|nr:hypothetical protein [Candidatus Limnocylindria bacterium]